VYFFFFILEISKYQDPEVKAGPSRHDINSNKDIVSELCASRNKYKKSFGRINKLEKDKNNYVLERSYSILIR
jgi:hypothetical protein